MANFLVANATPAAMFDAPGATTAVVAVPIGDKLNRFSFSMPSFVTSGVGMRGRFFCCDVTEPLKLSFESAEIQKETDNNYELMGILARLYSYIYFVYSIVAGFVLIVYRQISRINSSFVSAVAAIDRAIQLPVPEWSTRNCVDSA